MPATTAILIPTLGRPTRVAPLLANLASTTRDAYRVYFVVEPDDEATIAAVRSAGAELIVNRGPGSYASCVNTAFRETTEPFFFTGADDVRFLPGWLESANEAMRDPQVGVVGTVDPLHEFADQSTHSLVRRGYIDRFGGSPDLPGEVFHGYHHGFCDTEFICVAKARGAYRYCLESRVEHHHPGWDRLGYVRSDTPAFDATYARGNERHLADLQTFVERSASWRHDLPADTPASRSILKFVRRHRGLCGRVRIAVGMAGRLSGWSDAMRRVRRLCRPAKPANRRTVAESVA